MKAESIVFAVAGVFLGLIVGWVIGSQQTVALRTAVAPTAAPAQTEAQPGPSAPAAPPRPVDEAQAQTLRAAADQDPKNAQVRIQLGNLYFDADRYQDAAKWYENALALDPTNASLSTDLGVSYYYLNQPDRALQQFDHSLGLDPNHAKTMLNQGIVKAFGKQDLAGAVAAWEKLIRIAPTSPEADTARRALQGLKSAHPNVGGPTGGA